ncbi:MAG: hypothetical protein P8Y23_13330 [Candidatus Lokiarchaeota archaeon]|jgi:hypothetical protein
MSEQRTDVPVVAYFLGLLIVGAVGGILTLFTDFGGLYYYNGYLGIRTWEYINILNFPYTIVILVLAMLFFYSMVISILSLKDLKTLQPKRLFKYGFYGSIASLAIVVVGVIALGISGLFADDWWVDTSFYAGLICSILSIIIYFLLIKNVDLPE